MKLRLQIASVLPASAKPEPSGSQSKGVFGTTMQEMLGTAVSANPGVGMLGQAWPSRPVRIGTGIGTSKPGDAVDVSSKEAQLTSDEAQTGAIFRGGPQQLADQSELMGSRVISQTGTEGAPVSKEPPTEPVAKAATIEAPIVQGSIARKLPRVTSSESDQQSRRPIEGAASHLSGPSNDASPHATHNTETAADGLHGGASQSSNNAVQTLPQPIDFVVPVTTEQPSGSPAPSKSDSNTVSSRVRGQGTSRRAAVQQMISSQAEPAGKSFAAVGSQALAGATGTLASGGGEPLRRTASATSDRSTGSKPTPLNKENTSAAAIAPATQPLPSKAIHAAGESTESTPSQMDSRALKDTGARTGHVVSSEVKMSATVNSIPGPTTEQHETPHVPPAILHGNEKAIATHRPEANAAQVLQRMDMASSPGVVQLRADARRLDVGVTSGSLGWVEVRATTGPSGRVDATLQAQNDASAHVLASQSSQISSYAREHSVQLGQVSVGVGTGDGSQSESRSTDSGGRRGDAPAAGGTAQPPVNTEQAYHSDDTVSLISVRA
jgi:hypothetical protein